MRRLNHQYLLAFIPKPEKKAGFQRVKVRTEEPSVELIAASKSLRRCFAGVSFWTRIFLGELHEESNFNKTANSSVECWAEIAVESSTRIFQNDLAY